MAPRSHLDPSGLSEALSMVSQVMSDHAAALDRLELGAEWDDSGQLDVVASPSDEGARAGAAGSDLSATLAGVVAATAARSSFPSLAAAMAGAGASAVGPAGRGLAVVLRGLADSLHNADRFDAGRFAIGLELGAESLTGADDGGQAGCLPAVVAVAADAALAAVDEGAELAEVIVAAADEGLVELESGPTTNADLVERGVVDAAAAGFLLFLDVLASVVTGEPLPAPPVDAPRPATTSSQRFCVSCEVEPHEESGLESSDWLESTWHELGDLVAFDRSGDRWTTSLVTALPGAAIEAIHEVGRPRELQITLAPDA